MNPDIALGISSELRFLLKDGWTFVQEPDRFRVKSPIDAGHDSAFDRQIREEVWRIAQFVAYANFVSITSTPEGGFSLVSRNVAGNGFEILFEVT